MAQAKIDYGKVVSPQTFSSFNFAVNSNNVQLYKLIINFVFIITFLLLFYVWSRYKLTDLNLQISEISRSLKEAEQLQKRLKLEAASLKTPSRIETIAKNELGMALPTENQVIQVK